MSDTIEDEGWEFTPEEIARMRKDAVINRLGPLWASDKADWETPDWLFAALHQEFGFNLDVCATMENRKTHKFFSEHQDAFRLQWKGTCWMNPPYGRDIGRWIAKAREECDLRFSTVVCLVPARTDTNWWFNEARFAQVRFLKGRLRFQGAPSSAPFPSALLIFQYRVAPSTSYWVYRETKSAPYFEYFKVSNIWGDE